LAVQAAVVVAMTLLVDRWQVLAHQGKEMLEVLVEEMEQIPQVAAVAVQAQLVKHLHLVGKAEMVALVLHLVLVALL
jgi:hypothetical protein